MNKALLIVSQFKQNNAFYHIICCWQKAFNDSDFHFYDPTFPFLWYNVSVSTFKRFYSYDAKFPFLYGKVYSTHRICVMAMWN